MSIRPGGLVFFYYSLIVLPRVQQSNKSVIDNLNLENNLYILYDIFQHILVFILYNLCRPCCFAEFLYRFSVEILLRLE